ncbi:MAG: hypothetical protein SCK28_09790 [Bacillota bacterium]|nr:hypothetical protein [Bacillota bacterium]
MKYLTSSKRLFIRRTKIKDIEFILESEQSQDKKNFIIPWSKEQHAAALVNNDCIHMILENNDKQPIGFAMLFGIKNKNQNIEFVRKQLH